MYDLYALSDDNVSEDWKEGEDGRKGGFAVDDEEGYMINLQTVGEISDSCATLVGMGDDYDFVSAVYEFLQSVS